MEKHLQEFEKSIRKKHRIGWTPKYVEEFRFEQDKKYFVPLAIKTFEDLGWDLLYQDKMVVEAKRCGEFSRWTEKITVTYDAGRVKVRSVSLGNETWDMGNNSKRVKLFIYAFNECIKNIDKDLLEEIREEWDAVNNWDDYVVPDSLPQPSAYHKPNAKIPLFGGILLGILLAYLLAILMREGFFPPGFIEAGVTFIILFSYKYLMRLSNYPYLNHLNKMLLLTILLTYIGKEFFYFKMVEGNLHMSVDFFSFLQLRFSGILRLQSIDNHGWSGFLIGKVFEIGITWFFSYLLLHSMVVKYIIKRVPAEVIDFTWYQIVKEKSEEEARAELAAKGWNQKEKQDEVFDAVGAIHFVNDMNRME